MKSTYRFFSVIVISLALMLGALHLLAAPDGGIRPATEGTPVTASATIEPGTVQTMGDTDVTLTFAPGASGEVTVTLIPTTPLNPPPGGATTRSWFISTTAENYAVTATFGYSQVRPVDVVIAFDSSGSMEFNTLCYGCWTPSSTQEYPEGDRWPLPWNGPANGPPAHCAGSEPQTKTIGSSDYTLALIEAEEYSYSNVPYDRDMYMLGLTYWVMQRNGTVTEPNTDYLGDAGAYGRDTRGAYIGHFPYAVGIGGYYPGAGGVPCIWEDINNGFMCRRGDWITERGGPYPAPRVDYEFTVPTNPIGGNTWYFWIRAQGGDDISDPNYGQGAFWGLDGVLLGRGAQNHAYATHLKYNGADPDYWTWRRLQLGETGDGGNGNVLSPGSTHILNLWAGSAGFTIDQIVITNYSGDLDDTMLTGIARDNNRTDMACDPCDARFGGYPGAPGGNQPPHCVIAGFPVDHPLNYRYLDDIYDDEQELAGAAIATARFIRATDIAQHQVGLVRYSSVADTVSELACLESDGAACDTNVIENALVDPLMNRGQTYAGGSTNIPDALEEAIKMLSSDSPHYGRSGALPVIILITDGEPNVLGSLDAANADCDAGNLYPGGTPAQECTMFMAMRAREQGIRIYSISMGSGADFLLLLAIADATGGLHYHAMSAEGLYEVFNIIQSHLTSVPIRALYHRESAEESWQMYPLTLTEAAPFAITGKGITALSEWTLGPLPILMTAQPATLVADGVATSTIVATALRDGYYYWSELRPAVDGPITFTISSGTVTPVTTLTVGGVATAVLTSGLDVGQAIITATNGEMTGVVTIALVPNTPYAIALVAEKTTLPADGKSTSVITATVTDAGGNPVANGTPVTLTATLGTLTFGSGSAQIPLRGHTQDGMITATFTAGLKPGRAQVVVTAGQVQGCVWLNMYARLFLPLVLRH